MNVYLPDDLAKAVKSAEIEVSAVCQQALSDAVNLRSRDITSQLETGGGSDARQGHHPRGPAEGGAIIGRRWVREAATFRDLQVLDTCTFGDDDDDDLPPMLFSDDSGSTAIALNGWGSLRKWLIDEGHIDPEDDEFELDDWWRGLIEGAQTAWDELRTLVTEDDTVLRRRRMILTNLEVDELTQRPAKPGATPHPAAEDSTPEDPTASTEQ
ncbi:hypothetical protein JWS14_46605 (plasmid) [Rhodococcus koreensis]|nr:hypothetical protein JWS14_46605 [Rhodococcus koreensis]